MSLRAVLSVAVLVALGIPAVAGASVTIGSPLAFNATDNAPPGRCMTSACTYTQSDAGVVPVAQYVVPGAIAGGVITSWSFKASSGNNAIQVLRPLGGGAYVDVAHSTTVPASGGSTIVTAATRLPVQAGDAIGLFNDSNALVMNTSTVNFSASNVVRTFDPALGAATPAAPIAASPFSQLELQATIEPDADADGFGDETQDTCPSDPRLQTACSSDLRVAASGNPARVKAGQIVGYAFTVHNAGSSPAANASVALELPAGVGPSSLASTIGNCSAAACSLGTLANGATATITFSVATSRPGSLLVAAGAASSNNDPNLADNSASVTTTVDHPDLTLTDLSVYPRTFTRGNSLPRVSGRAKAEPSAIKFTLSEAAKVRLSFARIGRRNHTLSSQSFSIAGRGGDNRLIFSGILPGHVKLRAGQYRLTAAASTGDGRRARSSSVRFTVIAQPLIH